MSAKTELSAPKRRTRAEVQQLVAEFVSSGSRVQAKTGAQQPHLRPSRLNFPQQAGQPQRASTRKIGIVQRADSLSNGAVEAPNHINLILLHSLTIVREWRFGKMPLLSAVDSVMKKARRIEEPSAASLRE